jgi:hypothetical protein
MTTLPSRHHSAQHVLCSGPPTCLSAASEPPPDLGDAVPSTAVNPSNVPPVVLPISPYVVQREMPAPPSVLPTHSSVATMNVDRYGIYLRFGVLRAANIKIIFHLGFTQPLTEMSAKHIKIMFLGSKVQPVRRADNLTAISELTV